MVFFVWEYRDFSSVIFFCCIYFSFLSPFFFRQIESIHQKSARIPPLQFVWLTTTKETAWERADFSTLQRAVNVCNRAKGGKMIIFFFLPSFFVSSCPRSFEQGKDRLSTSGPWQLRPTGLEVSSFKCSLFNYHNTWFARACEPVELWFSRNSRPNAFSRKKRIHKYINIYIF